MPFCFLCFPDDPIPGYARSDNPNAFQVPMAKTCMADPCCCLASLACPCPVAMYNRYAALGETLDGYLCCQGQQYYPVNMCFKPGDVGEASCPALCLCLETTCCFTCAVSATRYYLMDKYRIHPDPTDYQIIRFNNACQCLACICNLAACFVEDLRECARLIDLIAHAVFCTVQGCMQVQTYDEIQYQKTKNATTAPQANKMGDRF